MFWSEFGGKLSVTGHHISPERVAVLKEQRGDDDNFPKRCYGLTINVGSGAPGRVFASRSEEFIQDVQALDSSNFLRLGHAKEFGIKSLACVYFQGGVVEYGTPEVWPSIPRVVGPSEAHLKAIVEKSGASWAMFWSEFGGKLSVTGHYITPERVAALKEKRGDDDNFPKRCYGLKIDVGSGALGRVYASKSEEFIQDVQSLASSKFLRLDHAKEFGIKSMACVYFQGGVVEFGTPEVWSSIPRVVGPSEAHLKAIVEKSGASWAMFWSEFGGKLSVTGHY